jgi:3-oxo-5-alpha-steroid 4-dehydrogenase 1
VNKETFNILVWCWTILAILLFVILLFVKAPYGRHSSGKWGLSISNRWGWFLMEIPSLSIFLFFLLHGDGAKNMVVWIIAGLFLLHYANRSLIYPFRIRTKGKKMPLVIVAMAVFFNIINGSILGYFLGSLQNQYTQAWLSDYRFISGIVVFFTGMVINSYSDETLIHLRKNSQNGYQIPRGGLFNRISCPNFFGEIIEWMGYALLCWSMPALSFFIWTFCNLVPRALDHHRWYIQFFPDYPVNRKAVFPWLL